MKQMTFDTLIATLPIVLILFMLIYFGFTTIDDDILLKDFFFFIILTPLFEELLFRGFIQKFLSHKINKKILFLSYANIITSVIFALSHIATSTISHSLLTFFPSVVFGLLYDRNQNIMPSIITHAVYNLNIFLIYKVISNF